MERECSEHVRRGACKVLGEGKREAGWVPAGGFALDAYFSSIGCGFEGSAIAPRPCMPVRECESAGRTARSACVLTLGARGLA